MTTINSVEFFSFFVFTTTRDLFQYISVIMDKKYGNSVTEHFFACFKRISSVILSTSVIVTSVFRKLFKKYSFSLFIYWK
jgi:hypothetical protein